MYYQLHMIITLYYHIFLLIYHEPPKTMKNKGFGHLKTQVIFHKKALNIVGCWGWYPWYIQNIPATSIPPTGHHVDSGLVLRYVSLALHMNPWVGLQIPWVDDFAARLYR